MSDPDVPPPERDQDGAELRAAYEKGWNDARRDCWAPVQTRWRYVQGGDVVLDKSGTPWMINMISMGRVYASRAVGKGERAVDLDDYVMVLQPMPVADAIQTLNEGGIAITPLSGDESEK